MAETLYGYMGKILRVDLTSGALHDDPLEPATGKPPPHTLKALGLERLIPDLDPPPFQ